MTEERRDDGGAGGPDDEGGEAGGDGDDRSGAGEPGEDRPSSPLAEELEGAEGALDPAEVERLFSVLEASVRSLDRGQLDRMLSVLEATVATGSGADAETVSDLVDLLEDLVVDPDGVDEERLDETLAVVEDVLQGTRDPSVDGLDGGSGGAAGILEAVSALAEAGGMGEFSSLLTGGDRAAGAADPEDDLFRIARIAAAATERATGNATTSGARAGIRMAHAAATEGSPADLLARSRAIALEELERTGVEVGDLERAWPAASETARSWADAAERDEEGRETGQRGRRVLETPETLRKRGERLLSESAELGREESPHPAFGSILGQLRPDEARILRLLATEGPQSRVEVHDRGYFPLTSKPVAECLTMIGSDAGCRHPGKVVAYLENLRRLGLATLSRDTVDDLKQYRILEAQPHVERAQESARWAKSVYGSVRLTDLGVEFCGTCFPFEVRTDRPNAAFTEPECEDEDEEGGTDGRDARDEP